MINTELVTILGMNFSRMGDHGKFPDVQGNTGDALRSGPPTTGSLTCFRVLWRLTV